MKAKEPKARATKAKGWDGTISDEQMLRIKAARHKHAEEVLERVIHNEPLMAQLRAAMEEERQGVPPVPWKQVQEEARSKRGER